MDNKTQLDRIEAKVDRLDTRVDKIDTTLAAQHVSLKEHMRRTALNERAIEILAKDMKPVQKHVAMVGGMLKVLGLIGIAVEVYKLIKGD